MFTVHRRTAPHQQRIEEIETFRLRSDWLNADDKSLLQMVLEKGNTFESIARLTGQSPSTVSRRFHRLLGQILGRELGTLLNGRQQINPADIQIIRDYFFQGRTQRAIARKRNISLYRVRRVLEAVRTTAAGSDTRTQTSPHASTKGASHAHTERKSYR